jgi:cell division protein FtsQ
LKALIKAAREKWRTLAAWNGLRGLLEKGSPRRIFVGRFFRDKTRVIRTARSAPKRRQNVRRRKRVLVARKKKVARVVFAAVRLGLLVGAVTFLVVDVHGYMYSSPRFSISHIAVEGNVHVTAREIIATSGMAEGQNIFRASLTETAGAIRKIPWVREVRVRRSLPDQIEIEIAERTPVALVLSREIFFMDETGKVLAGYDKSEGIDAPFITARGLGPLKPGANVSAEGVEDALEIIRLMDSTGVADSIPISEINIDDPSNIVMIAGRSGANILLGAGDLEGKLWRLARVASAIKSNSRFNIADLKKVDLRFGAIVPAKIEGG